MRSWAVLAVLAVIGCRDVLGIEDPELIDLGRICARAGGGADPSQCPPSHPICTTLDGVAYFCTTGCGMGPTGTGSDPPPPPADGDAICKLSSSSGTPACLLYGEATNGMVPWVCTILCGELGGEELGICPVGLTCTSNSCQ